MPPLEFECDRCGHAVAADASRYQAVLEVAHVAEPLELHARDLQRDFGREIRELLSAMARRDARELEDEVHCRRTARLCSGCRREVLALFARHEAARPVPPRKAAAAARRRRRPRRRPRP